MTEHNLRTDKIILMGDSHSAATVTTFIRDKISEGETVVHVGDVGVGFGLESYALDNAKTWIGMLNDICVKKNIVLYLVRGNHDNPLCWTWPNRSNVIFVQTGDVGYFPNGKKTLFIGGGISVDRTIRRQGYNYWFDEITEKLEHVTKTDFVFTHDAPEEFNHPTRTLPNGWGWYVDRDVMLMEDSRKQRANVTKICHESGAKFIISGHFHNSFKETLGEVKYQCLNINELFSFDAQEY